MTTQQLQAQVSLIPADASQNLSDPSACLQEETQFIRVNPKRSARRNTVHKG